MRHKRVIGGMQRDQRQRIEAVGDRAGAPDVIEVRVRVPQMRDAPAAPQRLRQNDLTVPGRIDHGRVARGRVRDQICVGLDGTKDKGDDFQHLRLHLLMHAGEGAVENASLPNASMIGGELDAVRGQHATARDESHCDQDAHADEGQTNRIHQDRITRIQEARQGRREQSADGPNRLGRAVCETHLRFMDEGTHLRHPQSAQRTISAQKEIRRGKPAKPGPSPEDGGEGRHSQADPG